MKLIDQVVSSFAVAKIFQTTASDVRSIDFSSDGDFFISSDEDELLVYDCNEGALWKKIFSKKYGVHLARFTKNRYNALHTSTKVDNSVRYLSLHDYKYIRYFVGHTKKVISLCVNLVEDTFISASLDRSVRIWDFRTPNCLTIMPTAPCPISACDSGGIILAIGMDSCRLTLFDLRYLEKGPFTDFKIPQERDCDWTGVKFSPDGKKIIVTTDGSFVRIIDTFTSEITLARYTNAKQVPIEASFSPDSQFLFTGSSNGLIHIWNVLTGLKVCALDSNHSSPVQHVQFCPKYMMLASSCRNKTEFWLPTYCDDLKKAEEPYSPEDEIVDLNLDEEARSFAEEEEESEDSEDGCTTPEDISGYAPEEDEQEDSDENVEDDLSSMHEPTGSKSI